MSKLKSFIFVCLIFFIFCLDAHSQWKWVNPTPAGHRYRWCKMWNANTFYAASDAGIFVKTTNRGIDWFVNPEAGRFIGDFSRYGDLYDGEFFDMDNGIIVGLRGGMRTTNGGLNFSSIPDLETTATLYDIYFSNSNTGYVCGQSGFLKKTTDGGNSWFSISTGLTNAFFSIDVVDDSLICLGSNLGMIARSSNAGENWSLINSGAGTPIFFRTKFINRDTGFVSGSLNSILLTTNGGVDWISRAPSFTPGNTLWYDVDIFNELESKILYLTGNYKQILKSSNLGISWDTIGIYPTNQSTNDVLFSTNVKGDTILSSGVSHLLSKWGSQDIKEMVKSPKFGTSPNNYNNSIWGIPGSGKLWVSGTPSIPNVIFDQIIFSSNFGNSWISQTTENSGATLYDIFMIDVNKGYVVGDSGTVLKTINGGENWNRRTYPTSLDLRSLYFISENTGWVVGRDTALFKTTNGGMNWVFQNVPEMANIEGAYRCKIFMIDENTGWIGGRRNTGEGVWKTTNGGDNWINQNPGMGITIVTDLKMLNANKGLLCGINKIRRTTNGGNSWDTIPSPQNAQWLSLDFLNSDNKFILNSFECSILTTDGGQSWDISRGNVSSNNSRIKMLSDSLYYTVGSYYGIFRMGDILTGMTQWYNNVPANYMLKQNYPNPFNPVTTIEFAIPKQGKISLKVYDITGREIRTLINDLELNPGTIKQTFDGSVLASGVYFYSLVIDEKIVGTKKMILLK